ncbi:MAG: FliH/SctL family protein [Angelakisella sp.]|nr:FliH/SctL family protein [Angelakisella sp.]
MGEILVPNSLSQEQEQAALENLVAKANEQAKRISEKIVSLANIERENILSQAKQRADEALSQAKVKLEEARQIKNKAFDEGINEGKKAKEEEFNQLFAYIKATITQLEEQQEQYFNQLEKEIHSLSLDICSKVLAKKLSDDDLVMTNMVSQVVAGIKNTDWISVEISDEMCILAEKLKKELPLKAKEGQNLEVVMKDIPRGSCIVQTPDGIIDASVSTQLENLRKLFESV